MNKQALLKKYVEQCHETLMNDDRLLEHLKRRGINERFIFESFTLGFADNTLHNQLGENEFLLNTYEELGIIQNGKEQLSDLLTIPIYDENKFIVNIIGCNLSIGKNQTIISLSDEGVFNAPFLKNNKDLVFADSPIDCFLLIQNDLHNATFLYGSDDKFVALFNGSELRECRFTFDGKASLYHRIGQEGISTQRNEVDFTQLKKAAGKSYLQEIITNIPSVEESNDSIQKIENGFLFKFNKLNYRILGNFDEYSVRLNANIKVYTQDEVFVDTIDFNKHRNRMSLINNIMDKFEIRDSIQIEEDINKISGVIEKYREKKANEKKLSKPELTEYQKDVGKTFLKNPDLLLEIENDLTALGYVREKKNKLLMYAVMTSRLLDSPLHAVVISRSGAGKSQLVDIVESLCPPENLESISDLSPQALYYYGEDALKNKFVVIAEKEGSKGSDYPLRELISKKSITKAIPMKDQVSGQIKTMNVIVNGPIALAETTTNGEINPENLNRCYLIGVDESEDQTKLIHAIQRELETIEGFMRKRSLKKIIEKHIYAQRMLKPINVFIPYATLLTFPSNKLKSRRDNNKLLKLIKVICFLHQFQRKLKQKKINGNETIEYIESTIHDYRIAYDLLKDGVLDNTLDDLPKPSKELLTHIKGFLKTKAQDNDSPLDKIIFERREIREYTSWSFAQIRNNFRILQNYENIKLIRGRNGTANKYQLSGDYSEPNILETILSPKELENRVKMKRQA